MMDKGREAKRYVMQHPLLVSCESWGEFVALYAADVSQGGMYIVVADPPPVMSEIDLQLRLPEGHEIPLRARVVHVLDAEQAKVVGRDPGIGVEFVDLDAPRKQQIHQLVEFARWQGASHKPTATLASHMFEMAAPAPPAEVLATLSDADSHALPPGSSKAPGPHSESIRSTGARLREPSTRSLSGASRDPLRTTSSGLASPSTRSSASGLKAPSVRERHGNPAAAGADTSSVRPKKKRATSGAVQPSATTSKPPQEAAPAEPPPPPPKPTDMEQLKIGMTHLARRRYEEAVKHFQEMLSANPGDPEATKWMHLSAARKALGANDEEEAAKCFRAAIAVSEDTQEARRWLRDYAERKRLEALPFGRYFVKKRPTF